MRRGLQLVVGTILNLIRVAATYVSEEVWYRLVLQIVTNRDSSAEAAAKTVFESAPCPHPMMGHQGRNQDIWGCGGQLAQASPSEGLGHGPSVKVSRAQDAWCGSHWSLSSASFPSFPPQTRGPIQLRFIPV